MLPGSAAPPDDDGAPVYTDPDAHKKEDSAKYTVEHWEEKRAVAWVADWESTPWAREPEGARLERVLKMALEAGHPGIDAEGIDTMIGFVQQGRFEATPRTSCATPALRLRQRLLRGWLWRTAGRRRDRRRKCGDA